MGELRWSADAFGTFWRRLTLEAKVHDLHFHVRPVGRGVCRHEYDGREGRFSGPNPYSGYRPGVSNHDRVGGGSMEQTRGVRSRVPRGLGDRSKSVAPSPAYQNDLSHPPQLIFLSSGYSKIWEWSARSAIDRLPGTAIPGVPSVRNAVNLPISAPGRLNNIEFPARIS